MSILADRPYLKKSHLWLRDRATEAKGDPEEIERICAELRCRSDEPEAIALLEGLKRQAAARRLFDFNARPTTRAGMGPIRTVGATTVLPRFLEGVEPLRRESARLPEDTPAEPDDMRLVRIYEDLRSRLLDLTKRNRLLNYGFSARSRQQLRFVDHSLDVVYRRLSSESGMWVESLPEPGGDAFPDEQTPEFENALRSAKRCDEEFLDGIRRIEEDGGDDDAAYDRLERRLIERTRAALGLPARSRRSHIDRADYARDLGIDPAYDAPLRRRHGQDRLSTLHFAHDLSLTMRKLADMARLSEQEAGLSTLYLAFGFLEWFESDASERPLHAPLLLMPVSIRPGKLQGRENFVVLPTGEPAEINVSLVKFLETKFGRRLPGFSTSDEPTESEIEPFLDQVSKAVEGLARWRVRRFLTLGHFSFSRIAIYEDTARDNWRTSPAKTPLVEALLNGYEANDASDFLRAPDDYTIDDPDVEKFAPILVQDADASQHSALIDVMKGSNLVIQGPPGTGKSQTISNAIANLLAEGRTVLFVAEKLAALEVVKRRLDAVGLGEFCLELHSDKASPKNVVKSLADRYRTGVDGGGLFRRPSASGSGSVWDISREEIGRYLDDLHKPDDFGSTPFDLMWKVVRGKSDHADVWRSLGDVPLPDVVLTDPVAYDALMAKLSLYSRQAQDFERVHGNHSSSPWFRAVPLDIPRQKISDLIVQLERLASLTGEIVAFSNERPDILPDSDDIARLVALDERIGDIDPDLPVRRASVADCAVLKAEIAIRLRLLTTDALCRDLDPGRCVTDRVVSTAEVMMDHRLAVKGNLSPAEAAAYARSEIERWSGVGVLIRRALPLLQLFGRSPNDRTDILRLIAVAGSLIVSVAPHRRRWIRQVPGDESLFREMFDRRDRLVARTADLQRVVPRYYPSLFPPADEVGLVISALERPAFMRMFGSSRKDYLAAITFVGDLGLDPTDRAVSETLRQLLDHAAECAGFETSEAYRRCVGTEWRSFDTPMEDLAYGMAIRDRLRTLLGDSRLGMEVFDRVVRMDDTQWDVVVRHREIVADIQNEFHAVLGPFEGDTLGALTARTSAMIGNARAFLAIDGLEEVVPIRMTLAEIGQVGMAKEAIREASQDLEALGDARSEDLELLDTDEILLLEEAVDWVQHVGSLEMDPALRCLLLSDEAFSTRRDVQRIAERARPLLDDVRSTAASIERDFHLKEIGTTFGAMDARARDLLDRRQELRGILSLGVEACVLRDLGLDAFLDRLEELKVASDLMPDLFALLVASRRIEAHRAGRRALSALSGDRLQAMRANFAEHDRERISLDREKVRSKLLARDVPQGVRRGAISTWTELSLLINEFPKQKRHLPVRNLLSRSANAVQALQPCFMMSPLSLAKFLPADQVTFDVLIIDEASQMRPEDAIGAMMRCRRIVVVGDTKQLPPTDFFNAADDVGEDSEDVDVVDDESILERCQKVFGEVRRLKWHYRSRCESLIRFSNERFYDGELITFPSSVPESFSIELIPVGGVYRSSMNEPEAREIVASALRFMRHHAHLPEASFRSFGIVAMNSTQREVIHDMLEMEAVGDSDVARYMERANGRGEPMFVKNLENVQGDERDHVMISLTYGPSSVRGKVAQRFGPVNSVNGHRRLNVLLTRARYGIAMFTSFGSRDVVPGPRSHEGVHALKAYLSYVETRGSERGEITGRSPDSDFEVEVARRLERHGFVVEPQVGVSSYRIDLGVRDPSDPGRFLAGIECDGARYHSSRSARDRDRLREEVLVAKGWNVLRVWSTDWFEDPDGETRRLLRRLDDLKGGREDAVPALRKAPWLDREDFASVDTVEPPVEDEVDEVAREDSSGILAEATLPEEVSSRADEKPPVAETVSGMEIPETEVSRFVDEMIDFDLLPSRIDEAEVVRLLRDLRRLAEARIGADFDLSRSILRDSMIETFVKQRVRDPNQWFTKIPAYQRQGTEPREKQLFLETICEIVDRMK